MSNFRSLLILCLLTVIVPNGEVLRGQTRNYRIGIIGNQSDSLSILLKFGAQIAASKIKAERNISVYIDYRQMINDKPDQLADFIERLSVDGADTIIINKIFPDKYLYNNIMSSIKSGVFMQIVHLDGKPEYKDKSRVIFSIEENTSVQLIAKEIVAQLQGRGFVAIIGNSRDSVTRNRILSINNLLAEYSKVQVAVFESADLNSIIKQQNNHNSNVHQADLWVLFESQILNMPNFIPLTEKKKTILIGDRLDDLGKIGSGKIAALFIKPYKLWGEKAVEQVMGSNFETNPKKTFEIKVPLQKITKANLDDFSMFLLQR